MTKFVRLDMLARILAGEKISVVYDPNQTTAMMDIKNRVLTVPEWQNITRNIHIMFIAHEVSHAKNTPLELIEAVKAKYKDYFEFRILNIVEDVRIEKLICLDYPKLVPIFQDAYNDLISHKFWSFPPNITELDYPFEERINAQAKMRKSLVVKFTDEEQECYDFLQKMVTVDDVVEGYGRVIEILKKDPKFQQRMDDAKKLSDAIKNGLSSLEEFLTGQKPGDTSKTKGNTGPGAAGEIGDVVGAAIRQIAAQSQDKAGKRQSYYYEKPVRVREGIIASRRVWRNPDDRKTVSSLVNEFQRRQAALVARKTRSHTAGDVSPMKLHKFAYSDDVFRTYEQSPTGKRHVIAFNMDCSGSMQEELPYVARRVVMLTDFCDRLSIPYQVYGFTDEYMGNPFLQLFYSSDMSKTRRHEASNAIMAPAGRFPIQLGGTPLSSCMVAYTKLVKKFKNLHNVDLMTSILLTDGGEYGSPEKTNYYQDGMFIETKKPVTIAEMMSKHLRDCGINSIHHHIGTKDSYPFADVNWKETRGSMHFSNPDEIFDLRICESLSKTSIDEKVYARMIAEIINNRI